MEIYLLFSVTTLIIGIIMITLGIVYRRKMQPVGIYVLIVFGTVTAIGSFIMCLCFGLFMR